MAHRIAVISNHVISGDEKAILLPIASKVAAASGQVIVITGCTSGLGYNLAKEYIRLGHTVAGCGRRKAVIDALNKEYQSNPSSFYVADTSDEKSIAAFAQDVDKLYGKVDVLICNAGVGGAGKVPWEVPVEHINRIVDVSLKGVMFTNNHFLPIMIRSMQKGDTNAVIKRVINVSSGVAHTSMPFAGDYCAVKCAVEGYSRCVAQAFKLAPPEFKDRIICVPFAPGVVKTEMNTSKSAAPVEKWCKDAAAFILQIPPSENGSSVVMPGYYSEDYQSTWIVPAGAKMNVRWTPPEAPK